MKKLIVIALLFLSANALYAQNLVKNPGFEEVNTAVQNPKVHCNTGSNYGGPTPATFWACWVNNPHATACMITEIVNSKTACIPPNSKFNNGVGGNMLHVIAPEASMSIQFNPLVPEYKSVIASCWVYVVRGRVQFGVGYAGNSGAGVYSKTTCQWEYLETKNLVSPANNLVVGCHDCSAEFYIDNVSVVKN